MDLFNLTEGYESQNDALSQIQCPVLVLGSQTDILFPIWQQKQLAEGLIDAGSLKIYEIIIGPSKNIYSRKCSCHFL